MRTRSFHKFTRIVSMTASTSPPKLTSNSRELNRSLPLTQLSNKRSGEKWTIAGRYKTSTEIAQMHSQTPGPGTYSPLQPNPNATRLSPPKYSMTPRRESKEPSLIGPGPGAYLGTGDGQLKTQISVSLQSRHSPKDSRGEIPGPGKAAPCTATRIHAVRTAKCIAPPNRDAWGKEKEGIIREIKVDSWKFYQKN